MALHIQAYAWNPMPALSGTDVLDARDEECLTEIRATLAKHDKLGKFGVALLHSHFPIDSGEVLVEQNDPKARTLTIKPLPAAQVQRGDMIPTMWRFDSGAGYECRWCNKNHC